MTSPPRSAMQGGLANIDPEGAALLKAHEVRVDDDPALEQELRDMGWNDDEDSPPLEEPDDLDGDSDLEREWACMNEESPGCGRDGAAVSGGTHTVAPKQVEAVEDALLFPHSVALLTTLSALDTMRTIMAKPSPPLLLGFENISEYPDELSAIQAKRTVLQAQNIPPEAYRKVVEDAILYDSSLLASLKRHHPDKKDDIATIQRRINAMRVEAEGLGQEDAATSVQSGPLASGAIETAVSSAKQKKQLKELEKAIGLGKAAARSWQSLEAGELSTRNALRILRFTKVLKDRQSAIEKGEPCIRAPLSAVPTRVAAATSSASSCSSSSSCGPLSKRRAGTGESIDGVDDDARGECLSLAMLMGESEEVRKRRLEAMRKTLNAEAESAKRRALCIIRFGRPASAAPGGSATGIPQAIKEAAGLHASIRSRLEEQLAWLCCCDADPLQPLPALIPRRMNLQLPAAHLSIAPNVLEARVRISSVARLLCHDASLTCLGDATDPADSSTTIQWEDRAVAQEEHFPFAKQHRPSNLATFESRGGGKLLITLDLGFPPNATFRQTVEAEEDSMEPWEKEQIKLRRKLLLDTAASQQQRSGTSSGGGPSRIKSISERRSASQRGQKRDTNEITDASVDFKRGTRGCVANFRFDLSSVKNPALLEKYFARSKMSLSVQKRSTFMGFMRSAKDYAELRKPRDLTLSELLKDCEKSVLVYLESAGEGAQQESTSPLHQLFVAARLTFAHRAPLSPQARQLKQVQIDHHFLEAQPKSLTSRGWSVDTSNPGTCTFDESVIEKEELRKKEQQRQEQQQQATAAATAAEAPAPSSTALESNLADAAEVFPDPLNPKYIVSLEVCEDAIESGCYASPPAGTAHSTAIGGEYKDALATRAGTITHAIEQGNLSLEAYLSQIKAATSRDTKVAISLKRAGRTWEALLVLRRIKTMQAIIEEADTAG